MDTGYLHTVYFHRVLIVNVVHSGEIACDMFDFDQSVFILVFDSTSVALSQSYLPNVTCLTSFASCFSYSSYVSFCHSIKNVSMTVFSESQLFNTDTIACLLLSFV